MSEPFLAEIRMFGGNFAPRGWAFCNGQILSIAQNTALFSLLGTTYGGNGQTTFALPDLRGRVPVHAGNGEAGPGLSSVQLGQVDGTETVSLTQQQMPVHSHTTSATNDPATTSRPQGAQPARGGSYAALAGPNGQGAATSTSGGSQPHQNLPPRTAVNFIIALEGIFPSRN